MHYTAYFGSVILTYLLQDSVQKFFCILSMISVSDFVVYTFSQLYRNIKSFTVHSSPFDQAHLDAAWKTRHLVASHIIRKKSLHALKHLHDTIYKMHSVKEIWLCSNKLFIFCRITCVQF